MDWIPVEERLPEECVPVLVTERGKTYPLQVGMYMPTVGSWGNEDVIAWMPLPAPYEPE